MVRVIHMKSRELEYILTVAQEGSIARAAEKLYVGQPAISKAISSVEKSLDLQLFIRDRTGMIPTEAGIIYAEYARRILEIDRQMRENLREHGEMRTREIRIAMTLNALSLTNRELNQLLSEKTGYTLRMDNVLTKDIIDAMRSGYYDYAVCPERILSGQKEFTYIPIYKSKWLLIAPKGLPISVEILGEKHGIPIVVPGQIRKLELIMQEDSTNVRKEIDILLRLDDHPEFHPKMVVANSMLAIEEVTNGAGCAVISDTFLAFADKEKIDIYILDTDMVVTTCLAYRKGRQQSGAEKVCIQTMCRYLHDHNDNILR